MIPGETLGPVISAAAKDRIETYITEAEQSGAAVLVDGRNTVVSGREDGYFLGATVLDDVTPDIDRKSTRLNSSHSSVSRMPSSA